MEVEIIWHALGRMQEYAVSREMLMDALENPSSIVAGKGGRRIYQKRLNGYVLRVVVEESKELRKNKVIILYKTDSERYEV